MTVKLKYLGTAAAEGIPGMFCNCKICRYALEVRGEEIKTRSQALLGDKILIDFPPDTYLHVLNYGLDLRKIHHCIITHSHFDHLLVSDLWCRLSGIAHDIEEIPMNIYLTHAGYESAVKHFGSDVVGTRLHFHEIRPFEAFDIEDYHVIPLAAHHDPRTNPVIYIIENGDQSLLYANDTGVFPQSTWDYLKTYGKRFDFISLDCTGMFQTNWRDGHMSLDTNKEVYDRMTGMGLCDADTVAYVNHFSHNGQQTHDELEKSAKSFGFGVAYDGFEIEI